jgi:hypothetical protein
MCLEEFPAREIYHRYRARDYLKLTAAAPGAKIDRTDARFQTFFFVDYDERLNFGRGIPRTSSVRA